MASDDMHVIIYKILAYLYDCMKRGIEPQKSMISHDGDLLGGIPYRYWCNVMVQLHDGGYVKGISVKYFENEPTVIINNPSVTLDGVQFMQENSMMNKALAFLKETKSAIPFI